ncbi:MAG: glycerate kinase [Nitriliruptorales bacterium]|nr:glycerate kinase [Nitriliruptorales bacterium]
MKVVLAPDKFAGTLSADQAARAMRRGWSRVRPDDEVVIVPMADGGEGTLAVVESGVPGAERVEADVADARGRAGAAAWLRLPDGRALVEAAAACGLSRLGPGERDPLLTTSYGVGQLLRAAVEGGATAIIIGLGGSATVDGGGGMLTALGHRLLREDGNGVKVGGRWLGDTARIVRGPDIGVPVTVASDVTNPLLGPDGAAAVFGPQKGADAERIRLLEAGLGAFADAVERDLEGGPWRDLPGAGAAGGLGFALLAFCNAKLVPGADAVADLVGLEPALRGAAVAITGEGSLDAQSAAGKAPNYVLGRARNFGVRVLAIAGRVHDGAGAAFDAVADLGPEGLERAAALVEERAADLAAKVEA